MDRGRTTSHLSGEEEEDEFWFCHESKVMIKQQFFIVIHLMTFGGKISTTVGKEARKCKRQWQLPSGTVGERAQFQTNLFCFLSLQFGGQGHQVDEGDGVIPRYSACGSPKNIW